MRLIAYTNLDNEEETTEVKSLYFNGYLIGERLLEDLVIQVYLATHGGELQVHADWPNGVDVDHWEAEAIEFALQHDCFSTTRSLDNDDGFIVLDQ